MPGDCIESDCFGFEWLNSCKCPDLADKSEPCNVRLFRLSLFCQEPLIDRYYVKNQSGPIDITAQKKILECLKNYYSASSDSEKEKALEDLMKVLVKKKKDVQYSPFVAFWKTADISYSVFKKLDVKQQKLLLKELIEWYSQVGYAENLNELEKIGDSAIELALKLVAMALRDSGTSRGKGQAFAKKLRCMVQKVFAAEKIKCASKISDFANSSIALTYDGYSGFSDIWAELKNKLSVADNKKPDFIMAVDDVLIVGEAKHLKEPGGAQSKQLKELLGWIKQKGGEINLEGRKRRVIYVAFLDGAYMGHVVGRDQIKEKIEGELRQSGNYFVNTAGFIRLLETYTYASPG